ncbi:hypothetical protein [Nocardioides stalactiti]|uniref:hypothetical protein n=1 Tax=Nocardioides stalactiti TaxID=2755356 RepID=UPI001601F69D|nr:hypothetical protein [Nocardioides stalactiti]
MMERARRRRASWGLLSAAIVLVLVTGCGEEPEKDAPRFTERPEISAEGSTLYHYDSLDEMAAASGYIIRGRVLAAGPGRSAGTPGEDLLTFRTVDLEVLEVVKGAASVEQRLTFEEEGYETDGTGYVMNGVQWSFPGDEGWYYLREGSDGVLRLTSDHGRFSTKGEHPGPSGHDAREHGPWGGVTAGDVAHRVRASSGSRGRP